MDHAVRALRNESVVTAPRVAHYAGENAAWCAPLIEIRACTVHQTGRACAIRRTTDPFEVGLPKVEKAFGAAANLVEFYRRNRDVLDRSAKSATPAQD